MLSSAAKLMHDGMKNFAEPGPNPRLRAQVFRRIKVGRVQFQYEPGYHCWLLDNTLERSPIAHHITNDNEKILIEVATYWVETGEVLER